MPIESAADFNSYVDINTSHGVTATFFEVQQSLWDQRVGLIDTWFDIDSGNSTNINIIIDQEYFNIEGGTVLLLAINPEQLSKRLMLLIYHKKIDWWSMQLQLIVAVF